VPNCEGPSEQDYHHLPHNGLSMTEAIAKADEIILFHLNIELGDKGKSKRNFAAAAKTKTEDVIWREKHPTTHSYFSVSTTEQLTSYISDIYRQGDQAALARTRIAYEGKLLRLGQFVCQNSAEAKMRILEGESGGHGLRYISSLMDDNPYQRHQKKVEARQPYLVYFEPAQTWKAAQHRDPDKVVGREHVLADGRIYRDQLNLSRTGISPGDIYPKGCVVLAFPYMQRGQDPAKPKLHWRPISDEVVITDPNIFLTQVLCWKNKNMSARPRQSQFNFKG
jgi:hypothetical protein